MTPESYSHLDRASLESLLNEKCQELEQLRQKNSRGNDSLHNSETLSIDGLDFMLLRIDDHDIIRYANTTMAQAIGLPREDLVGTPKEQLQNYLPNEITDFLNTELSLNESIEEEIKDYKHNRILKIKITHSQAGHDIIMQDITSSATFKHYAQRYLPIDIEKLSEEDLSSFLYPEKRFMSVLFADLNDFTKLCQQLAPEEIRTVINNFLEEVISSVENNKGTLDKIIGDGVMAFFGAPISYTNHAFRAVKTACDILHHLDKLRETYNELGQQLPGCSIAVNSGDMIVGNIGSTRRQDYTILGVPVSTASKLCDKAPANTVLVTQHTFDAFICQLPQNWEVAEGTHSKNGTRNDFLPLPQELEKKAVLTGPGVKKDPSKYVYKFHFLYMQPEQNGEPAVPILSVESSELVATEIESHTLKEEALQTERIFGKYRLLNRIKRGGSGEIWKAKDNNGNIIALKILIGGEAASPRQRERFRNEAHSLARLSHRNISKIIEVGEFDRVPYIAMEYIQGINLSELIFTKPIDKRTNFFKEPENRLNAIILYAYENANHSDKDTPSLQKNDSQAILLPRNAIINIMIRVAAAVQYAHYHNIVHRDLKPSNIMIRPNGEPVVTDFGLAKLEDSTHDADISISGEVLGTVDYMAPEQARSSSNAGEPADVYSLGTILYLLLTGKKQFQGCGNIISDVQALQNHTPLPPEQINPEIDQDLSTIVTTAISSDESCRYLTVTSLRHDLESYLKGKPIHAKPLSVATILLKLILRNRTIVLMACFFFIILFIFSVGAIFSINQKRILAEDALQKAQQAELLAHKAST